MPTPSPAPATPPTAKPVAVVGPYVHHNFGDDLIGAILVRHLQRHGKTRVVVPFLGKNTCDWLRIEPADRVGPAVANSRGVVIGGGGILGDSGVVPNNKYLLLGVRAALMARRRKLPVVITAAGAGPLKLLSSRLLCRLLCRLVDRVGIRDDESLRFLTETLGVPREKVVQGADVALAWPDYFDVAVVRSNRIGVQFDAEQYNTLRDNDQQAGVIGAFRDFCQQHGGGVTLVSNGASNNPLFPLVGGEVEALNYAFLPEFLGRLSGLRSIVTSHLHLSIAAYAARVPCFAVYVRQKTERFFQQINRPECALDIRVATPDRVRDLLAAATEATWSDEDERRREQLVADARRLLDVTDRVSR